VGDRHLNFYESRDNLEIQTDIILPDLGVRAAETFPLWDAAEDTEA
jgi:hypothetical protein